MVLPLSYFVNSALCGPCCCRLYTCVLKSCEQLVSAAPAIVLWVVYCVLCIVGGKGRLVIELPSWAEQRAGNVSGKEKGNF